VSGTIPEEQVKDHQLSFLDAEEIETARFEK